MLLFFSCISKDDSNIPLYNVVAADFEDVLTIDGTVQSVNSINISCPQGTSGEITMMAKDGSIVKEGDVVCKIKDEDLLTTFDAYNTALESTAAELAKMIANQNMELALLDAQVKTNDAQTSIAELDSLELKYSSINQRKIKELELEKIVIQKKTFQNKLKTLEIIQRTDVKRLAMRKKMLNMRLSVVKEQMDALDVKAMQTGMILRSINPMTGVKWVIGDMTWNGVALFTIPNMKKMKVMISASESSYKRIEIANPITYTFNALPADTAWGKIVKKSPIGKPIKRNSKVKEFEMEASVDSSLQIPSPGLSAECNVMLRRVADTIVVPQIAVFEEDSIKVVYVKMNKGFERREVLTGLSSPKETIISVGLNLNEKIALLKPASSLIINKKLLIDSLQSK